MKPILLHQQGHTGGSGAHLARALHISHSGPDSRRTGNLRRYIINYGVSNNPSWTGNFTFSNNPASINNAVNKTRTLELLRTNNVPCIEGTNDKRTAAGWLAEDERVVVRATVSGHSGAGLSIVRAGANLPNAPLYTRYFRKDVEYRVHIAFGNSILIQQKKRTQDADRDDPDGGLVRINANGWAFAINDLDCDARNYRQSIIDISIRAVAALGLAHGAVDLLVRNRRNGGPNVVVCEVNSAPALRNPSTLQAYVNAFRNELTRIGAEGFGNAPAPRNVAPVAPARRNANNPGGRRRVGT